MELQQVRQELQAAVAELFSPFRDLVQARLKQNEPLLRAAVVWAAGGSQAETPRLQQQRLFLATALEMLYTALTVHKLLLLDADLSTDDPNQKTVMGSIILAGDYCFTRSAFLAAQTDNPQVVEIFSQTLKSISETMLRHLFAQKQQVAHDGNILEPIDTLEEQRELFLSGIKAAQVLSETALAEQTPATDLGRQLADQLFRSYQIKPAIFEPLVSRLAPYQQNRWRALLIWLGAK